MGYIMSISLPKNKVYLEDMAKQIAIRNKMSLASLVVEALERHLESETKNSIGQGFQDKSPIKQVTSNTKQTTLDKVCHNWILDCDNYKRQNEIQDSLSFEDNRILSFALSKTGQRFIRRLPKQKSVSKEDKEIAEIKQRALDGKIRVTTMEEKKKLVVTTEGEEITVEEEEIVS
jgi:uncharacterized protein YpbB